MAPLYPSKPQEVHVHCTGFGPFGQHEINPSWEAVRKLDDIHLSSPPQTLNRASSTSTGHPKSTKRIRFSTSLLPVKYSSVLSQIPPLHHRQPSHSSTVTPSTSDSPDLILHVGVGLPDKVRIELVARKWGYEKLDVEGHLGPVDGKTGLRGFPGEEWTTIPEELTTMIDGSKIAKMVREKFGFQHVETSRDAGLYLCEFTYFCSLASALNQNSGRPTPVLFVHVPPIDQPYSLEELTQALQAIVWTIVSEGGIPS